MVRVPLIATLFFFLILRRPPGSPRGRSSAASDVYKRQRWRRSGCPPSAVTAASTSKPCWTISALQPQPLLPPNWPKRFWSPARAATAVSYTHLRAHETVLDVVCRHLLEKKKNIEHLFRCISRDSETHGQTISRMTACMKIKRDPSTLTRSATVSSSLIDT